MKNVLLAQSGGPTAAINATIAGAYSAAVWSDKVGEVYGAVNGIKGVLNDNIITLTDKLSFDGAIDLLCSTPSAALGSCRLKLKTPEDDPESYERIIEVLRKYDIGIFVYTGGNDSMDTVYRLSGYLAKKGIDDIKVMGAPKTIDNDLCETDHCPGFGSAAKYIAVTFSEIYRDCNVYDIPAVTIVEVMGRNAGWLTTASALASINGEGPDLIYLPERAFDTDNFVKDVKGLLEKKNAIIIAVSEGVKKADGSYVAEDCMSGAVDVFGHKYLAGVAKYLETVVKEQIGCKVRSIELNLMQRCASHVASAIDIEESFALGEAAVNAAMSGVTGEMTCIKRIDSDTYETIITTASIDKIANKEKIVPPEYINEAGNYVTQECIDYLLPLIQGERSNPYKDGLPVHIKLY